MGAGVARQCSRNRCLGPLHSVDSPSWRPRPSKSSELEERPGHRPNPGFPCPSVSPGGRSGSPPWPRRQSRSSELQERPDHGPIRGFRALQDVESSGHDTFGKWMKTGTGLGGWLGPCPRGASPSRGKGGDRAEKDPRNRSSCTHGVVARASERLRGQQAQLYVPARVRPRWAHG
jgi:hypothetical protein